MNRLLSLLLIPFFVLGQALPHSHAGTGVHQPDDHAARPHLHLSGGHSHHHDGDDHDHSEQASSADSARAVQCVVSSLPDEHDSDAVYIAQSNSSLGRASTIGQLSFASVGTFVEIFADRPVPSEVRGCKQSSDQFAGLPIYLLVASLRL